VFERAYNVKFQSSTFAQECLSSNKLDTAASYLIILQNLEKMSMARQVIIVFTCIVLFLFCFHIWIINNIYCVLKPWSRSQVTSRSVPHHLSSSSVLYPFYVHCPCLHGLDIYGYLHIKLLQLNHKPILDANPILD